MIQNFMNRGVKAKQLKYLKTSKILKKMLKKRTKLILNIG